MSFLAPAFLAGMAAAAIPLLLHLLKREPEPRLQFAAVKLLRHAPVEQTEKRRLRELLLLALRMGALVLLALAFARPFLAADANAVASGTTVIAIDRSYSLSGPGRIERARQLAREALASVPGRDLLSVVTFSDEADVAMARGSDRVLAASAIDQVTPTSGATRYRAALAVATQQLAGRPGTIVIVTDLQEGGWDAGVGASVPEGTRIEIRDVGALPPNLAVTDVRPLADRVVATVRNAGPAARDARVHLTIDNRPAGDATASLGPNQSADVTFPGAPRGTSAAVTVEDPDGLRADNTRYAVLDGTGQPTVLVVSGSGDLAREGFFVHQALAAGSGVRAVGVSAAQLSAPPGNAAGLADAAVVIVLSTRGLERRGREALGDYTQKGGGLFVAAGQDVDGDVVSDVIGGASTLRVVTADAGAASPRTLAPVDGRHPVFQPFVRTATLGLVTFQRAARIAGTGCQTLARFTTGETAMIECPAGEGRALVLASDLDGKWSDFPKRATFVPFVQEAVRYLGSARRRTTEYVVSAAPAGVPRVPGVVMRPATAAAGVPRPIAINVDTSESNPARLSVDDFQAAVARVKTAAGSTARLEARSQEDRQHLWQYALALMAVMLAVEGVVASRTS